MIFLIIGWKDKTEKRHHENRLILKIMVQTKIPKSFLPLPHNSQGVPCFGRKICCSVFYQTERQAEIKPVVLSTKS